VIMADRTKMNAFALNCSLKGSDASESSSTDKIIEDLFDALERHGVSGEVERAADYNIKPGVLSDESEGDEWPGLRSKVLAAEIFILETPIWLGQPSSIAKRVVERMDAFLSETDDAGRMLPAGKVAIVAVVGNEDGAHHCHAAMFHALNDVGFTIPANVGVYWVGEADAVHETIDMAAANSAHLARLQKDLDYPGAN